MHLVVLRSPNSASSFSEAIIFLSDTSVSTLSHLSGGAIYCFLIYCCCSASGSGKSRDAKNSKLLTKGEAGNDLESSTSTPRMSMTFFMSCWIGIGEARF